MMLILLSKRGLWRQSKMEFKNPASTADIIVENEGKVLLVKRKNPPYREMWAIPGGFIEYAKETLEDAARRELREETGLEALNLTLVGVYSAPDRDPRGHVIAHVYSAEVNGRPKNGDDAKAVKFFSLDKLPKLAFDHDKIIKDYIRWSKNVR